MVSRLLTIGLCATCVALLARSPRVHVEVVQVPVARAERVAPSLSVVDVAAEVAPSSIPALMRLGRGEWIRAINDQRPDDDVQAEHWISAAARPGGFLDLTIAGDAGDRRVLLLIH